MDEVAPLLVLIIGFIIGWTIWDTIKYAARARCARCNGIMMVAQEKHLICTNCGRVQHPED